MKKLLSINITLTFLLILWGGLVRSSGAGLACPDWPTCNGYWIPPMDPMVLLEWGHRLIASVTGFCTLGVVGAVFLKKKYRSRLGGPAFLCLSLLVVQILLGALTVKGMLSAHLVTTHLAVALVFLATLLWMRERISPEVDPNPPLKGRGLLPFVTLLVYLQILWGGWVASSHAGLACPDFPTCFGAWVPPLSGLVAYQFFHRVGAVVVTAAVILLFRKMRATKLKGLMIGNLMTVLIQFSLGIANVVWELPIAVRIAHLAMATSLFAMMFIATHRVHHARVS